jgi:exosortase D (VPLPA-CTERM-specific)
MLDNRLWADRWPQFVAAAVAAVMLAVVFQKTFVYLYANWQRDEYSHGFLIPPISAYLLWQRRNLLGRLPQRGSWLGVTLVALGLILFFLSFFASIVGVDAYALVIVVAGFALAELGWQGFRIAAVPIALLLLMTPIPTFWYNNLSSWLQLVSSQLGVGLMRIAGVSVFLEGNVIDLGEYKLQVAEACSGLRYLFPLMTLGAVVAYIFKGRAWARWCIFLSTAPITVLMNGLRVGIIGVLVDRFGIAQAEGFLHQFEGWVVFMACFALLIGECRLLLWLTGDKRTLRQGLGLESSTLSTPGTSRAGISRPAVAAAALLVLAAYPAFALPQRAEVKPDRADFSQFPTRIGDWVGRRQRMEDVYLDWLQLDDYLLADFMPRSGSVPSAATDAPVNLYVAYYASQRSGRSVHSPSSCLPGGGWRIERMEQREVQDVRLGTAPLRVNRAIIRKGSERELVYYWFQQRGRNLTSEYLVKWYLFKDGLTRDRTDGGLVRLITPLHEGEDPAKGDNRLGHFAAATLPVLAPYLPD